MKRLHFVLIVGITLIISGCGQKGPLYLPESTRNASSK
ncbi:LPS translocon maturation chaperone LptM [Legionella sainthelensi]|nr:lipoprotein [Legionella sainthelensi]